MRKCFIVDLEPQEKAEYDKKRKREGKTSQGVIRKLILDYIKEGKDGHSNN